jgi:hypothetical protein
MEDSKGSDCNSINGCSICFFDVTYKYTISNIGESSLAIVLATSMNEDFVEVGGTFDITDTFDSMINLGPGETTIYEKPARVVMNPTYSLPVSR